MRTMPIVLVVIAAVSTASAGPRITVILSVGGSGGGCGPGYRPMPMPTCGGGYFAPQAQLVRCSACFQIRPIGTICGCQQRNYGCGNGYVAQGGYSYQGGYLPQGGYNNQISAIEAERRRLGYLSSGYRDLERAQRNFERANNPYPGGRW